MFRKPDQNPPGFPQIAGFAFVILASFRVSRHTALFTAMPEAAVDLKDDFQLRVSFIHMERPDRVFRVKAGDAYTIHPGFELSVDLRGVDFLRGLVFIPHR